jgi:hypothetical protein
MSEDEQEWLLDTVEDHLSSNPTMCCSCCGGTNWERYDCYLIHEKLTAYCSTCRAVWRPLTLYEYSMEHRYRLVEVFKKVSIDG